MVIKLDNDPTQDMFLTGAIIFIDEALKTNSITSEQIENVKALRKHFFNKIYSPHIKYYIKQGKYKLKKPEPANKYKYLVYL